MTNEQQILIDRLVDGELDDEQQRELLLSCEQRQTWREVALAFVESQTLVSELTLLMQRETTPQSLTSVGRNRAAHSRLDWSHLSLAAAILLLLGIGYGLGWIVQNASDHPVAAKKAESPEIGDGRLPSIGFMVSDPMTNGLRQVDLPVLRASDLGSNWLQQLEAGLPEDFVQELRGSGLDIKRTRTFTPVDLGDGRRVIVPIEYFIEQRYQ